MALILSIETATEVCSVALHDDGALVDFKDWPEPNAHATQLGLLVRDLMQRSGYAFSDLDAVAVSEGPGSYTGLRIGTSLAKGICYAAELPLISISTLQAIALGSRINVTGDEHIVSMIDARRMEVYCQSFGQSLVPASQVEAVVVDGESFAHLLEKGKTYFVGNGAAKCRPVLTHTNAVFPPEVLCSAVHMGTLAAEKFKAETFEDLAGFTPLYLKEFIAKKAKPLF